MSKQSQREETERLIREALEKKTVVVKQGSTRIETKCGKCGAPNRVTAEKGVTRVKFSCKECGHAQELSEELGLESTKPRRIAVAVLRVVRNYWMRVGYARKLPGPSRINQCLIP